MTSSGNGEGAVSAVPDLDDFSQKLAADDARVLVDLLKLAVANRAGERGREALSHILTALGKTYPQVAEMLLELCVTELEDVATDTESGRHAAQPVVQESPHPYTDDTSLSGHVRIHGQKLRFSHSYFSPGALFSLSLSLSDNYAELFHAKCWSFSLKMLPQVLRECEWNLTGFVPLRDDMTHCI